MKKIDVQQTRMILHNLNSLESSFRDYSEHANDFTNYKTYFSFMNSYALRNQELWKFYLLSDISQNTRDNDIITSSIEESLSIDANLDFSVGKCFSFPNGPLHSCEYYTLLYMMEDSGNVCIENENKTLLSGDFILIPPDTNYALDFNRETICIFFNIRQSFIRSSYGTIFQNDQIIKRFMISTFDNNNSADYLLIHTNNNNSIQELSLSILSEYINCDKFCRNAMQSYLSLLFTHILREADTTIVSPQYISQTVKHFQEISDYIFRNYKTATLSSVSEEIHFSKQYVCRIIKESTGETFNTYLQNIKLEIARSLLLDTKLSIEQICEATGFSSPAFLSRSFKNKYGVPPSKYRNSHGS